MFNKKYVALIGGVVLFISAGVYALKRPVKEQPVSQVVESSSTKTSSSNLPDISEANPSKESSEVSQSSHEAMPVRNQEEVNQQLVTAVAQQNNQAVKEALEAGADVESRNERQATALLVATQLDNLEIAKLLLAKGANVNLQDQLQDSPFLFAGAEGRLDILKELAKHNPDQGVVNRFGGNALIPAAEKGHLENVRFLLAETDVAIDHVNTPGWTALLEAIALTNGDETQQAIVKELLANGANPNIKDSRGISPLRHARQLGYGNIAEALVAAGGVE